MGRKPKSKLRRARDENRRESRRRAVRAFEATLFGGADRRADRRDRARKLPQQVYPALGVEARGFCPLPLR